MLRVNDSIAVPRSEFQFSFARSPGPGGQNVNKVNSKAILKWDVVRSPSLPAPLRQRLMVLAKRRINQAGVLLISSHRFRDQARNVDDCLNRLRELLLAAAVVPKHRTATRPTAGSRRRRQEDKKKSSALKSSRRARWRRESE